MVFLLVIIANARYYEELLRNRPVESDSTGNRTYYETSKISIVLEPVVSRAKRSRRHARRRLRDATLYSALDTPTRPLDPLRSRRNGPSRHSFAFGDFLPRNDISSPQTDIFFRTKGSTSLPFLLARARVFSGPRRLFHRSSSFPSRGRTRARTRRRAWGGSFDEKSIVLSSK